MDIGLGFDLWCLASIGLGLGVRVLLQEHKFGVWSSGLQLGSDTELCLGWDSVWDSAQGPVYRWITSSPTRFYQRSNSRAISFCIALFMAQSRVYNSMNNLAPRFSGFPLFPESSSLKTKSPTGKAGLGCRYFGWSYSVLHEMVWKAINENLKKELGHRAAAPPGCPAGSNLIVVGDVAVVVLGLLVAKVGRCQYP